MRFENVDYLNLEEVIAYAKHLSEVYSGVQYVIKYPNLKHYSITLQPIDMGITIIWSSDKGYWGIGKLGV